jgi:alkylresorcinol/alkylpyrone synthase
MGVLLMTKILSVSTVSPPFRYRTEEIVAAAERLWLRHESERTRALGLKVLRSAEITERYSVAPLETVFSDLSFGERNELYIEAVKAMSELALVKACASADVSLKSLDYLITTSCTGLMIPSVCAHLVNKLGLRQDIVRLPVTEMGCAGGTSGLIYAERFLRASPKSRAAVVAVEAPSITFQKNDLSPENLVSTAIFADGAACAVLGGSDRLAPAILDSSMYHFPESTHLMGYRLTNTGLKIVLDREVPSAIAGHFGRFFHPLLERNGVGIADIRHFAFHPGGKKILQAMERLLEPHGKSLRGSREVLRAHGNLSSATVLFVLERILREEAPANGDLGYLLAFGPGFTAQSLLVRWREGG